MERELAVWPKLRHPNVVELLRYFDEGDELCECRRADVRIWAELVMPLCRFGHGVCRRWQPLVG